MVRGARLQLTPSDAARTSLIGGTPIPVQKFVAIERDAGDAQGLGKIAFIITDGSKDRYGDNVSADGWDFENFNANPVLLWAHDYSLPPVGKMGKPWKTHGAKVKAEVQEFTPGDLNPMGPAVEGMIRKGFLNAVSVGFLPTEFTWNEDYSMNYIAQELLEVSVVPVPANANALIAAKSAGLWVPAIELWVAKQLDEKKPGLVLEFAQRAWSATRDPLVSVPRGAPAVEKPLEEVVDLASAVRENTAVQREVLAELRSANSAKVEERASDTAATLAAAISNLLTR